MPDYLDDQIRNTTKNVAIILVKVHNLQVEVKEMRDENRRLLQVLLKMVESPGEYAFDDGVAKQLKFGDGKRKSEQ